MVLRDLHPVGGSASSRGSASSGGLHPGGGACTDSSQHRILQDTVNVSYGILLECILVCFCLQKGSGKVQTVLTTLPVPRWKVRCGSRIIQILG